jgi:hypothetical protein
MDLGKIMIGIALVMLAAGLLVSPSSATGCDHSCIVGCGSTTSLTGATVTPYSPLEREDPAGYLAQVCGNIDHGSAP